MKETRRNIFVGLFTIVGLLALAMLMTSFGELPAFFGREDYELIITVNEPSGIAEGDQIMLSGVQVGRVLELRFRDSAHLDRGVEIVTAINKQFQIPNTAVAVVQPAGLGLGRGKVILRVLEGEAPPLSPGASIEGRMGSIWGDMIPDTLLDSVDKTVVQFGEFVQALTPVADDLHELLEKHTVEDVDNPTSEARRVTANLSTVIERFDATLRTFNETFGDERVREAWFRLVDNVDQMGTDARSAVKDIRITTESLRIDLKRITDKLESGVDDLSMTLSDATRQLRPALENAAHLFGALNRVVEGIEKGDGSAGMFVRDPRLYESLVDSGERLKELLDTIQRLMSRFERQGAIGVKIPTAVGNISRDIKVPDK